MCPPLVDHLTLFDRNSDRLEKSVRPLAADQRKDVLVRQGVEYFICYDILQHHFVLAHLADADTESQIDQTILDAPIKLQFVS